MAEKKYVVAVVGVMKKNGQLAPFGEEVSSDDFHNFDERVEGGYIKAKVDFEKDKKDADAKQLEASEQKSKEDFIIAYKKAFKVDAPADASTEDIKKAIDSGKLIESK